MALFDLAIVLGGIWNVDELAENMPLPLLNEWLAYFQIRPTASPMYRHAQTAGWVELFKHRFNTWFGYVVWGLYRYLVRHEGEILPPNDFALEWLSKEELAAKAEATQAEGEARLMSLIRMYGKPVKHDND